MATCQFESCSHERHFHIAMFKNRAISRIEHYCLAHGMDAMKKYAELTRDDIGTGMLAEYADAVCFDVECVIYIEGGPKCWFYLREVGGRGRINFPCDYGAAASFVGRLANTPYLRPNMPDTFLTTLREMGGTIIRTIIEGRDFANCAYRATIVIEQGEKQFEIDARPSDALLLAHLSQTPFFLSRRVISRLLEYYGYITLPVEGDFKGEEKGAGPYAEGG